MHSLKVTDEHINTRLDLFLSDKISGLSRTSIKKLCDDNKVLSEGEPLPARYKVKLGDVITLSFNPDELHRLPKIDLPILYEDDDCIVIDKPSGVLTHSKGVFNPEGTVATFIKKYLQNIEGERAGIVHRLDRGTSGIIICAKHELSAKWLQKQFATRRVKKTYIAVISGTLNPPEAIIQGNIARNPKKPQSFHISTEGKTAETAYKTLQVSKIHSLVEMYPKTGRTHQIRVHLQAVGHPIVGDTLYGGENFQRLLLHASNLELTLFSGKRKTFSSELPEVFYEALK